VGAVHGVPGAMRLRALGWAVCASWWLDVGRVGTSGRRGGRLARSDWQGMAAGLGTGEVAGARRPARRAAGQGRGPWRLHAVKRAERGERKVGEREEQRREGEEGAGGGWEDGRGGGHRENGG
jgi:hypothetical protein